MRLGLADHLGWAVAVTADDDHDVVDRRRIELVEPGVANMPIHHDSKSLDLDATARLVDEVRASSVRAATAALDELADSLRAPITSMSIRTVPPDFPVDLEVRCRVPYEARADAVMYRQVLTEVAQARGWTVCEYDAKAVEARAREILGSRAEDVLDGPRARLGAPWAKDHRVALAATVVAGRG